MDQLEFNFERGEELKAEGQERAARSRAELLEVARYFARKIARGRPERRLTMDDVQRALIREGHTPSDLGNAAGSVFRGKEWKFTGVTVKSERVSNHCRRLPVWEFVGTTEGLC